MPAASAPRPAGEARAIDQRGRRTPPAPFVALWRDEPVVLPAGQLRAARSAAVGNRVHGALVRALEQASGGRALPDDLTAERQELDERHARLLAGLGDVARRLGAVGVVPVLVKTDLARDVEYSNVDVVVGDDGWDAARAALAGWGEAERPFRLEPDKVIVHPPKGMPVHLHRSMCWFDVPLIATPDLRRRAVPGPVEGLLVPDAPDEVRTLLAHALFQNLTLDLADLLWLRELWTPAVLNVARRRSAAEGWGRGFDDACRSVEQVRAALDAGHDVPLPAPLPVGVAVRAGLEHARHLARTGRPGKALREAALRGPLVQRKLLRGGSR